MIPNHHASMTINQVFDRVAADRADHAAATLGSRRYTYGEIDRRAATISDYLKELRVGPGDVVGVLMDGSMDLLASLIAILRVGAAYVPLETRCPSEQTAHVLAGAGVRLLLTDSKSATSLDLTGCVSFFIDTMEETGTAGHGLHYPGTEADDPACLTYGPFTGGRLRAAAVSHRLVTQMTIDSECMRIDGGDVFLLNSPLASGASILEIWGALLNGARLVLLPAQPDSFEAVACAVPGEGVTVLSLPSAMFNTFIDRRPDALRGVRLLLTGGEVISVDHARRALELLPATTLIGGFPGNLIGTRAALRPDASAKPGNSDGSRRGAPERIHRKW